ncbi:ClC family H(+)/Cl(-) exchange transporter [Gardnerella vaginalis]|uniref:ClC family H(+)/Cl(-) exchange transporter n=1 Tax=Gardnerella vaginalis TaxID=2702 RepID=A0A3E1IRP4_GARVA|nr:ClC family H(+)/Cl(-) exchange transporter [Gardnerella vaginalis]RFD75650.1 ClC family H(+)/Cl(-) exchange transporter [Gardnerella vaginalis]
MSFKNVVSFLSKQSKQILETFCQLRWKVILVGVLVGVVSGSLVAFYRFGIEYGTDFARWMYLQILHNTWWIVPCLIFAIIVGLIIGWMSVKESMASGSGIPQVVGYVRRGLNMRWHTILPVRFVGGLLGSLFGLSLGREGPSIQIGACGAQMLSRIFRKGRRDDIEEHYIVTAGAAAGLSAAFSAPLSGVMFALEEVQHGMSSTVLMGAAVASLFADFVSQSCFGLRPVLDFGQIPDLPMGLHIWLIPLGIFAGFVGSLMNRSLLGLQTLYGYLPQWMPVVVACLIAIPVGLFLPEVLGGGSNLVRLSEYGKISIAMLCLLFVAKMLFTSTSFGCGAPGGIFMPILAVGALAGGVAARSITSVSAFGIDAKFVSVFAVCVMAGTLSASVKAPLTSILLTVEMSGTMIHTLPVAACAFIALLVSDILKTKPVYGELLERYMQSHGDLVLNNALIAE